MYLGEMYGIYLALDILKDPIEHGDTRPMIIYTDNQAAIRSSHTPHNVSGQYMIKRIINSLGQLNRRLEIHWIPAHLGVPGNEEAARLAPGRQRSSR